MTPSIKPILRVLLIVIAALLIGAAYRYLILTGNQTPPWFLHASWLTLWWPLSLADWLANKKMQPLCWLLLIFIPVWWTIISVLIEKMVASDERPLPPSTPAQ